MSPPEVWGPPIWRLIHTLAEKLNENAFNQIAPQLFYYIVRICKFLPCPECSADASRVLAKVNMKAIKTKEDFVKMLYVFHNHVNVKKRKSVFNYLNIEKYKNNKIIDVYNNFALHYQTRGNMKLLNESFQRDFVIKDFKSWFIKNIKAFISVIQVPQMIKDVPATKEIDTQTKISPNVVEEVAENVEEVVIINIEKEVITNVEEEEVITNVEEEVITNVEEEVVTNVEEEVVTNVEEEVVANIEPTKKRKSKNKNKNKN